MKIVYLIAGTFNAGGMERVLTNKVNWLVAHGHEVGIVTTDQRGREPYFPLDAKVQTIDLNINYDADNGRLMSKLLLFPVRQWRHRRRLERLLRQWRADVVVCMFNNDASFVHRIADGSRKVLEVHFSKNKKLQYGRKGLWRLADWWRTRKEERLVGRYDRLWCSPTKTASYGAALTTSWSFPMPVPSSLPSVPTCGPCVCWPSGAMTIRRDSTPC